jgi:radical SAM protein with 4Fe4S-binding SPASM domain
MHCYINQPASDLNARKMELSLDEITHIAEQAKNLGALWCLVSGGEPLLRQDFFDIYLTLKKKGLLLSLFTNACLVTEEHIKFLHKYPPRDIEVTVYGVTEKTYERVTHRPGSYTSFRRGLDLLLNSGIKIYLKTMALRSNVHELPAIASFCRERSGTAFRFDPHLHLRYDRDPDRNKEIAGERLTPEEVVAIEQADDHRSMALEKNCDQFIFPETTHDLCNHLFHCGAGNTSFAVSYDGIFRLCADLWHPDCTFDLRKGTLAEAWNELVPRVRDMRSDSPSWMETCRSCNIPNLCIACPAHAHLETGLLDGETPYFCQLAHARAKALEEKTSFSKKD